MSPKQFFDELRRRSVYKVAITYAVVGWLLIQIATQVFPFFEIPAWAIRFVVLLIGLGFPIALILAWAFELTPEGIQRAQAASSSDTPRRRPTGWIWIAAIAGLAALALYFGRDWFRPASVQRAPAPAVTAPAAEKSIAVLPFENRSEDNANAYFADGIQDEILARLSKISDLKVISRTSTQKYKNAPINLRQIAQELGVTNVLEGSVQKAQDQVRVTVQLINALNDSHLWAETYDRKLTDIFAVESEVAQRIAASLEAHLTGREKSAIQNAGTKNQDAYDAYLRALALRNTREHDQFIEYLRKAVALDPNFADAWAALANAESLKYRYSFEGLEEQAAKAREAAERALALDPNYGGGHAAMGAYYYYVLQDYDRALLEFEKAIEQHPNDADKVLAIGLVKRRQGKIDEALARQLQAAELDPLNDDVWTNLARTYRGTRQFPEAFKMWDRALAVVPTDDAIQAERAETYLAAGDIATAERIINELNPEISNPAYGFLVGIYQLQRRFDEAIAKITKDSAAMKSVPPFVPALVQAGLGELHFMAGRPEEAKEFFARAETELKSIRIKGMGGYLIVGTLMSVEASLGRREEMEQQVAELTKEAAVDKWRFPATEGYIARAYIRLGDHDRALQILERLMKMPGENILTAAYLKMDPSYDPIRNHPRFQKLLE